MSYTLPCDSKTKRKNTPMSDKKVVEVNNWKANRKAEQLFGKVRRFVRDLGKGMGKYYRDVWLTSDTEHYWVNAQMGALGSDGKEYFGMQNAKMGEWKTLTPAMHSIRKTMEAMRKEGWVEVKI